MIQKVPNSDFLLLFDGDYFVHWQSSLQSPTPSYADVVVFICFFIANKEFGLTKDKFKGTSFVSSFYFYYNYWPNKSQEQKYV